MDAALDQAIAIDRFLIDKREEMRMAYAILQDAFRSEADLAPARKRAIQDDAFWRPKAIDFGISPPDFGPIIEMMHRHLGDRLMDANKLLHDLSAAFPKGSLLQPKAA